MQKPRPGIYKHYKGGLYEVHGIAVHSETEEEFVVYRSLYGTYRLNVRPLGIFIDEVDKPDFNYKGPRFTLVNEY
jgi:hypothetical protein